MAGDLPSVVHAGLVVVDAEVAVVGGGGVVVDGDGGEVTTTTIGATAAVTLQTAAAMEVPMLGETGVPLPVPSAERLPLGPLPGSRYPDPHIEAIDAKRFKGSPGTGAVERVATGFR